MSTWNCCRGIAQWRRIPAFSANLTHQSTDQPTAEALRGASDDAESVEIEPAIRPEVADDRTLAGSISTDSASSEAPRSASAVG